MSEGQQVPSDLAQMPPGPTLAAVLETLDESALNGHDLVTVLRAQARQVAHLQAKMYASMAAIAHCPPGDADSPVSRTYEQVEYAADEIRAALTWTRRKADAELGQSLRLTTVLGATWQLLHEGGIDLGRAWTISTGTLVLDDDAARAVEADVLDYARTHTTGQIAAKIRRLVFGRDPQAAKKRYDDAVRDRRVGTQLNDDGTGNLYGINLPIDRAAMARSRIEAFAKAAKLAGDTRTIDQVRADVFLDLLCGRHDGSPTPANSGAVVQITVPISTLTAQSDQPGEIAGWGPVVADIARQFVRDQASGQWRWVVTDPATGRILGADVTRRRPTPRQRRLAEAQSPHCSFVGCRMPAIHADIDHIVRHTDGGPTDNDNLRPACRHDHRLKDHGGWRLRLLRQGVAQWTSPLGHTYLVHTEPADATEPLTHATPRHTTDAAHATSSWN